MDFFICAMKNLKEEKLKIQPAEIKRKVQKGKISYFDFLLLIDRIKRSEINRLENKIKK